MLEGHGYFSDDSYPEFVGTMIPAGAENCEVYSVDPNSSSTYTCKFPTASVVKNPYEPEYGDDPSLARIDGRDALMVAAAQHCFGPAAKRVVDNRTNGSFRFDVPGAELSFNVEVDDHSMLGAQTYPPRTGPAQFHLRLSVEPAE